MLAKLTRETWNWRHIHRSKYGVITWIIRLIRSDDRKLTLYVTWPIALSLPVSCRWSMCDRGAMTSFSLRRVEGSIIYTSVMMLSMHETIELFEIYLHQVTTRWNEHHTDWNTVFVYSLNTNVTLKLHLHGLTMRRPSLQFCRWFSKSEVPKLMTNGRTTDKCQLENIFSKAAYLECNEVWCRAYVSRRYDMHIYQAGV